MKSYLFKRSGPIVVCINYFIHKSCIVPVLFLMSSILINCKGGSGTEDKLPEAILYRTSPDQSELLKEIELKKRVSTK